MARKELYYTVEDKGRDNGKKFYIREMSATQAEWWAIRAILAMANNGINLPDNLSDMGMAGMAKVGLEMVAKIPPEDARPLLDELMKCVQAVPNPDDQSIKRPLIDDDTEEVITRLKLRGEVFKLHVDFLTAAAS
ncbi:hypothetical protein ACEV6G_08370 [Enterobacter ludwigii]|jgi:hypothetical protein|uniref:hypothetical protein n=1 Tax=Enterobacter cloacae complex TaxID=354276 RepID=UPI0012560C69|nr:MULTISPECIES: hypothetical protein [Enterobacter cloacae complex]MDR7940165.1 hypothetical protein [Enterobacter soli]BBT89459.1 hypothetical protein WP8W19C02_10790 [Enterobacter cloacae]DAH73793.1 MAG TPA: tail assembly chaperone protein [Caudoviricetes sp.]MCY1146372.1 hypothetical protein [Enterobacter asburiae]VAE40959.1 Uncharacterised protein [Enterobacter hormaechei]